LIAIALLIAGGIYFRSRPSAPLTEKDTVVLADFENTTGDPVFDGTLKQALAVDLEQSPFLNILSDRKVGETLRLMGRTPTDRVTQDVARELCLRTGSRQCWQVRFPAWEPVCTRARCGGLQHWRQPGQRAC